MTRKDFIKNRGKQFEAITNSDQLYQKAPCGFISFLPNGTILRVNETLMYWMGIDEEQMYEMNFETLLSKGAKLYYQMVVFPLLNLRGFASEIELNFAGEKGAFNALFNAVAYNDEHGELVAVNATLQSINDRKKYEEVLLEAKHHAEEEKRRFEFLSNTIPNMVWTALPNGEVNFINQRVRDYLGELSVQEFSSFLGVIDDDRPNLMIAWGICLKEGRKLSREVRISAQGQPPQWFLLIAEPYLNEQGLPELWFGSYTNIHKMKLLQMANYSSLSTSLSLAHKTIDTHNEAFLKIAFDQSHMIRKPLANILGIVSLLSDMPATEEAKELIGLLTNSATELDNHVKEVVNSTKV